MKPDADLAETLHLAKDEDVILLRRVRLADMVLFCIESTHLPWQMFPDLLERFNPRGSLYQTLEDQYAVKTSMADEVAEAGVANAEEARLLRVRVRAPRLSFHLGCLSTVSPGLLIYVKGKPVEFVACPGRSKAVIRRNIC